MKDRTVRESSVLRPCPRTAMPTSFAARVYLAQNLETYSMFVVKEVTVSVRDSAMKIRALQQEVRAYTVGAFDRHLRDSCCTSRNDAGGAA